MAQLAEQMPRTPTLRLWVRSSVEKNVILANDKLLGTLVCVSRLPLASDAINHRNKYQTGA